MTSSGTKSAIGQQEAQHARNTISPTRRSGHAAILRRHVRLKLSPCPTLHGDPMMQLASSSIRSASRRVVQRWGGIAMRLASFRRWSLGGMGLLPPR